MAEWVPSGQTVNQQYYEYGRSTVYGRAFIGRSTTEPKCTTKNDAEEEEKKKREKKIRKRKEKKEE